MNSTTKQTLKSTIIGMAAVASLFVAGLASADTYTVQSGDTLSAIAEEHNTTVEKLVKINKISDRHFIQIGQEIELDDEATDTSKENELAEETPVATEQPAATAPVAEIPAVQSTQPAVEQQPVTSAKATTGTSDDAAKEIIAQRESGGSYTAQNGQYIGRYQLSASYLNGDYSAANQERVADAYVAERYGSWSAALAFWNANGWY